MGDGTDPAGLILEGTTKITGGTLAFAASEALIDVKATNTISSAITGTGGLTLSGSGTLVLSGSSGPSGPVIIDSGTLQLSTASYFPAGTTIWLSNVKSHPSAAILAIAANETLAALNSDGNNSTVTIATGDTLTIGDPTDLSSTLSSTITAKGSGSLIKAGTGLLDISGASVSFATGTVAVDGGVLRIGHGVFGASATTAISLAAGTELQYVGNGGSVFNDPVSGAGVFHLVSGTVQLTSTTNTYLGGTIVETGATLDITTANLPTNNENITDAGGMVLFDQNTTGTFTGVISDGHEMGTGPMESGSLDKDDSSGNNSGNVTLQNAQAYSGATYVEAGTLTLGAVNTIADSSGVILGRVGGGAAATLALGANNTIAALSSDASSTTTVDLNGYVLTLAPTLASSSVFGGSIVNGSAAGSLVINGTGDAVLTGVNTFSGGVTIDAGTLELGNSNAAGSGAIAFGASADPTLKIDLGDAPTNQIDGIAIGDTIDLQGVGTETTFTYSGGVLTVSGGSESVHLDIAQPPAQEGFALATDGNGGTLLTVATESGPAIASVPPATVENGQTTEIATVTPGLAGDTLTLVQTGGSGAVSLQLVNGVEEVIYTAPASIPASTIDAVSYTVTDEYNDVAIGSANVQLDAGPIAGTASITVGHNQTLDETSLVDGLVTPGLAGDTETITNVTGNASLSGQTITYQSPASGTDSFSYTVQDQLGDTATGTVNVTVNSGPAITSKTPSVVENGQTTVIGTVKVGLAGDTLSLEQTGGIGAISLHLVNGVEEVIYTAPANVAASMLDTVSYTITDEHNDVAMGSSTIPVAPANDTVYVGTAGGGLSVGNGNSAINGTAGNENIQAGNGADVVFAGPSDTISLGNGNDTVLGGSNNTISLGNGSDTALGGSNDTIQAGNGTDVISTGANSHVTVGNNPDTVTVGANSTVVVGNGQDSVTAGADATIIGGNGNDTVTAANGSTITLGNGADTVIAGTNNIIKLGNGADTIYAAAGDTITVGNGHDTFAFGLAPGQTTAGMLGPVTINGFNPSNDVIKIASTLASWDSSYAALTSSPSHITTNSSGYAVIHLDISGDTITLMGVSAASLHASDFQFV